MTGNRSGHLLRRISFF